MRNADLIAEARDRAIDRPADNVTGMVEIDALVARDVAELLERLADALEAQPAPLVADSREALAAVIHERFNMARGRGGVAPLALADQILASGVVSLAGDRDRARVAWERGRIFGEENWSQPYDPDDYNPYRESEGKGAYPNRGDWDDVQYADMMREAQAKKEARND